MKKIFIILGLVGVLAIGSAFVYADKLSENGLRDLNRDNPKAYEEMENWHEERIERRKENLQQAIEDGKITEEDSKTWEEHFDYMDKFHEENGSLGKGFCHGRMGKGKGMMGRHMRGN